MKQPGNRSAAEPYIPDLGIVYPSNPDEHMTRVQQQVSITVDDKYPFLDKSFKFRFMSGLLYLGIFTLVFILSPLRFGLKIEGRSILRKHRKLFRNGAMTVSNHMHRWDLLFALQAVRYRRLYFPAWKENLAGKDRNLIRLTGGIPVPTDLHVMRRFNEAFDELHARRKWFHAFPEGCSWPYYQPIRPFKKGVFTMAYRYGLPVIPMAFSYRKPAGLFRLFKGKYPFITLRIGEPLFPDTNLNRKEAVIRLREECHRAIVELAGITDNPYPCEGD
ncbi:lysophospholipid acyltransferase family protein [Breznakiella homolactica]|uniref:1-acyl-sn-glycerol-3-phosphate acyltransferase n=1 Tax=Breznakiella homolactica TaxID=2798577 RepID=A0A7T8BAB0_9SPIR|nr:lysophospholipid acyltransferase family protein [Breznakiella homolactica]QQO08028.1 1-acyl-sn-glycerol-3-phosphate acyltransferase [Breznakiella homolactica]